MHLRSISMKGFKSFPTRTKLEFGTGVSVIVGPNGSGKSNITDAVLWALGEQSPLAVRGQAMKDVIFAGAHGVKGANAAEVEVVIDNGDGALDIDFSEISIVRKLERDGEGEYRLNGARCRLVDVVEVLSDSGLGKEMHSVVSQGKVEQIVLSRPRERRLLIEEAAGLGKHRKRRRRAHLKLERTEENLSRALDVEREARSRLRPLKRQAEAAELHERLERQTLEARYSLSRDGARSARLALAEAEERARTARGGRDEAERLLGEVARRREQAEEAFAAQTRDRERLQARLYAARSASERITMRLERVREQAVAARERRERRLRQVEVLEQQAAADADLASEEERPEDRIAAIERELAELDAGREQRLEGELVGLERELESARVSVSELEQAAAERRSALEAAEQAAEDARAARRDAERAAEAARARVAEVGAELAAVNQFVRGAAGGDGSAAQPLAERLHVEPGYELALAAVLGPRLTATVVNDRMRGSTSWMPPARTAQVSYLGYLYGPLVRTLRGPRTLRPLLQCPAGNFLRNWCVPSGTWRRWRTGCSPVCGLWIPLPRSPTASAPSPSRRRDAYSTRGPASWRRRPPAAPSGSSRSSAGATGWWPRPSGPSPRRPMPAQHWSATAPRSPRQIRHARRPRARFALRCARRPRPRRSSAAPSG